MKCVEIRKDTDGGSTLLDWSLINYNSLDWQDWQKISSTKAVNRYRPPSVTHVLSVLELAQEHHAAACTAAWLSFLGEFQSLYLPFRNATRALAALDALQSLGGVARSTG